MRKADWLIGLLIAAVILAIMYYYSKANAIINEQNPDRPSVEETLNRIGDDKTTLDAEDDYDEGDGNFPDDTTTYTPPVPTAEDIAALNAAKEATANAAVEAEAENRPPAYENTASTSSSAGDFLVVAGTFKQMINAETALKQYKKKGYANAEIGKFNKKSYASLIVGRFATQSEANNFAKAFNKKNGTQAYVHKKR